MNQTKEFIGEAIRLVKDIKAIDNQLRENFIKLESQKLDLKMNGAGICKRCFSSWAEGNYSLRLKPQRKVKNRIKYKLKKNENLTSRSKHWLNKLLDSNFLVLKCHNCNHETTQSLIKPKTCLPKITRRGWEQNIMVKGKRKKMKDESRQILDKLPFSQTEEILYKETIASKKRTRKNKSKPLLPDNSDTTRVQHEDIGCKENLHVMKQKKKKKKKKKKDLFAGLNPQAVLNSVNSMHGIKKNKKKV